MVGTELPVAGALQRAVLWAGAAALLAAPAPAAAQTVPLDTAGLAAGPFARMEMLLERTIFRVDVLTLRVRLGPEDARRVERLAAGRDYSKALADSLAPVAAGSTDAFARIEFQRGIRLGQFVSSVRGNMRKARDAGYLTEEEYRKIADALPGWFAFLRERPIRRGDELLYRIRGDSLRTVFRTADGEVLLNQTDVGPERRLAVLGSYFAPGSDFREKLIRSLFP